MILLKLKNYRLILGKIKGINRRFYNVSAIKRINKKTI